jgi:hypothetical protein
VLREKRRTEGPIPIGNENLANELCSLLARAEIELSILSGKGVDEFRGIIDLRHIWTEGSLIRQNSLRFLEPFRDPRDLNGCHFWSKLLLKEI